MKSEIVKLLLVNGPGVMKESLNNCRETFKMETQNHTIKRGEWRAQGSLG